MLVAGGEILCGIGELPQRFGQSVEMPPEILSNNLSSVADLRGFFDTGVVLIADLAVGIADARCRGVGRGDTHSGWPSDVTLRRCKCRLWSDFLHNLLLFLRALPLSPKQISFDGIQHVVHIKQISRIKDAADISLLLGPSGRILLITNFQVHQTTWYEYGFIHSIDALHKFLHGVEDTLVRELGVVVPGDALQTIPAVLHAGGDVLCVTAHLDRLDVEKILSVLDFLLV